jgi:2-keto-3-deoxy-L-rhamnonate aldolase RhmA
MDKLKACLTLRLGMMENKVKEKIGRGEVVLGTFLFTPSPTIMEVIGYAGLDFAIIDTEHAPTGPFDTQTLENMVRAAEISGILPLVRLPERSRIMTQKALDAGAMGVVVPWVKTKGDAQRAVKDAKYPPEGHRGSCYLTRPTGYSSRFTEDYWHEANKSTMVVPMIEDQEGVDNLEEILSVEGVDFMFFGSRDFSMSSGFPTVDNPVTQRTIREVNDTCRRKGVPLARFLYPPFRDSVMRAIEEDFTVLVVGGDISLLHYVCKEIVKVKQKFI